MNIAILSTLKTILEQGSFTAAAEIVGCSPSAVSLQVKQMEQYGLDFVGGYGRNGRGRRCLRAAFGCT